MAATRKGHAQEMVRRLVGVYGDWPFPQERTDECVRWFQRLPNQLGEAVVERFTEVYTEVPKNIVLGLNKIRAQVDEHGDFRALMDKIHRDSKDYVKFRQTHSSDGAEWNVRRAILAHRAVCESEVEIRATWGFPDHWRLRVRACDALLAELDDPFGAQHHYPVSSEDAREAEQVAMRGMDS